MAQIPPSPAAPSGNTNTRTILLVVGGVLGFLCLCGVVIAVVLFTGLSLLGTRVSSVFSEIESGLLVEGGFGLPTPEPLDTRGALSIGDTAQVGSLEITLLDVQDSSGNEQYAPDPGNRFVVVELEVRNTSANEYPLSILIGSFVQQRNDDTAPYSFLGTASLEDAFNGDGDLPAGDTVRGQVAYEVPEDAGRLYWIYVDIFSGDYVVFEIGR